MQVRIFYVSIALQIVSHTSTREAKLLVVNLHSEKNTMLIIKII